MDTIKISDKILEQKPKYTGHESDGVLFKIFKTNDKNILTNKRNKLEILHSLDINHTKLVDLT